MSYNRTDGTSNITSDARQRAAIIQSFVKSKMAQGLSYEDAWNLAVTDPSTREAFAAMEASTANRTKIVPGSANDPKTAKTEGGRPAASTQFVGGTGPTVMNKLAAAQAKSKAAPAIKPGEVYPDGFAGGPGGNTLRTAGAKI